MGSAGLTLPTLWRRQRGMATQAGLTAGQHIPALDGMRGYAAIAVVLTHMMGFFAHRLPVEAGLLAVDLFFVMSGLVIEKSYGPSLRDGTMTMAGFIRRRLLRLYPLYVFGGLLGCVTYLWHERGDLHAVISAAASLATMLPQAFFGPGPSLFAFNSPSWSLSIEMFGGIAFAFLAPRIRTPGLIGIAVISFAVLTFGVFRHHTMNLGPDWQTLVYGIARFCYSYPAGILIWRHRNDMPQLGGWAPLVLAIAMYFPNLPAGDSLRLAWIALALPAGVVAAVQWNVPNAALCWCKFFGQISYPVYIIHVPVLGLTVGVLGKIWGDGVWADPLAGTTALVAIAASSVMVTYFVEPDLRRAFERGMRHLWGGERRGTP